jgi:hypothetical protein
MLSDAAMLILSVRQHPAAALFRLLGIHPGPDISAPAAASLAGLEIAQARKLLARLAGVCLIAEHAPGRFAFHDLLRAYAAEQARSLDPAAVRQAAIGGHWITTCRLQPPLTGC